MAALIFWATLATWLTQVGILWILQLSEGINHPGLYLSIVGLGFLCWCFAADPSS